MLAGERRFDCILVDGFDADARAGALDTLPFYQACRARLTENGLLGVNLLGRNKGFSVSVERLRNAFDDRVAVFPSCDSGNTIAFATGGAPLERALEDMPAQAQQLKKETRRNLLPTITRLQLGQPLPDGLLRILWSVAVDLVFRPFFA